MKTLRTEYANGILMAMAISAFFLICEALGQTDNFYLRLFNIVLVAVPVNWAIMTKAKDGNSNYLQLFKTGITTSLIGLGLSVIALGVYMNATMGITDIEAISSSVLAGSSGSSIFGICLSIGIEAFASAFLITFILLQYWKNYASAQQGA